MYINNLLRKRGLKIYKKMFWIFVKKICPYPWGFYILAFARGAGICWGSSEGRAFVYKQFLPFLEFSL